MSSQKTSDGPTAHQSACSEHIPCAMQKVDDGANRPYWGESLTFVCTCLDPLYSRQRCLQSSRNLLKKEWCLHLQFVCWPQSWYSTNDLVLPRGVYLFSWRPGTGWPGGPQEVIAIALKIWKHVSEDNLLDCFNHLWVLAFFGTEASPICGVNIFFGEVNGQKRPGSERNYTGQVNLQ